MNCQPAGFCSSFSRRNITTELFHPILKVIHVYVNTIIHSCVQNRMYICIQTYPFVLVYVHVSLLSKEQCFYMYTCTCAIAELHL